MNDSIANPPEKDPKSIMTVADQGQGGLEEKTRSNSTTLTTIALTKDNPASTTHQSRRKQPPPSKIAEDGARKGRPLVVFTKKVKVSKLHKFYKKAWKKETFGNQAFATWYSRTVANRGLEIEGDIDDREAQQKLPTTMGSNEDKSQEMALKSKKIVLDQGQEDPEATTRLNSTTQLTVDLVKDNPHNNYVPFLNVVQLICLVLFSEKNTADQFPWTILPNPHHQSGSADLPIDSRLERIVFNSFLGKVYTMNSFCIPADTLAY
jgi:hypothetical protein